MSDHEKYMRRAIEIAALGRGRVEPNPMVGAVLVRDGEIIAEGRHEKLGGPHAEINAIKAAGNAGAATLYVNLEPCNHEGRTPPCTRAIVDAGIARVVYAMDDPNPGVTGGGARVLRDAGISVEKGVLKDEARALNQPFIKFVTEKRPYVTVKWAMTLDGKIATASGDSKWISCEASREAVHRMRSLADAVLVGEGTVKSDDPLLTARIPEGRNPVRCVISPMLDVPQESEIVKTAPGVRTLIFCSDKASASRTGRFLKAGVEVVEIQGRGRTLDIEAILEHLGGMEATNLLVEGGGETIAGFFASGCVDKVVGFLAAKIVGGRDAKTPVEGKGIMHMKDAVSVSGLSIEKTGDCYMFTGMVREY